MNANLSLVGFVLAFLAFAAVFYVPRSDMERRVRNICIIVLLVLGAVLMWIGTGGKIWRSP